jgi:hypothetical protein
MSEKSLRLTWIAKFGVGLAIGSFIPWLLLPVLPFLPLTGTQKAIGAGFLLGLAEVMFWAGVLLAGQEVVRRYRSRFKPRRIWDWVRGKYR